MNFSPVTKLKDIIKKVDGDLFADKGITPTTLMFPKFPDEDDMNSTVVGWMIDVLEEIQKEFTEITDEHIQAARSCIYSITDPEKHPNIKSLKSLEIQEKEFEDSRQRYNKLIDDVYKIIYPSYL